MKDILNQLYDVIAHRKLSNKENSYTSYLFECGRDKILKKFAEESAEVVIAAKNEDKNEQIEEMSDLIYHMLVLMNDLDVTLEEVEESLKKRRKKTGNLKSERREIKVL